MSWRLCNRLAHTPRAACALPPEWQLLRPQRPFQSLALIPSIGPRIGAIVPTESSTESFTEVTKSTLEQLDDMAQLKSEVKDLQQLLGLVPPTGKRPMKDVIFVCIDCEAYEHAQHKITEIGMLSHLPIRKAMLTLSRCFHTRLSLTEGR